MRISDWSSDVCSSDLTEPILKMECSSGSTPLPGAVSPYASMTVSSPRTATIIRLGAPEFRYSCIPAMETASFKARSVAPAWLNPSAQAKATAKVVRRKRTRDANMLFLPRKHKWWRELQRKKIRRAWCRDREGQEVKNS